MPEPILSKTRYGIGLSQQKMGVRAPPCFPEIGICLASFGRWLVKERGPEGNREIHEKFQRRDAEDAKGDETLTTGIKPTGSAPDKQLCHQ